MLSTVYSAGLFGIDGFIVSAECNAQSRIPRFELVGLPDLAVKEAKERVRTACENSGYRFPALELTLNLPKGESAPHIVNLTLPNIKSETMLHFLSSKDICVSSGSACSSHSKKTSRALLAFGLSEKEADCSLRISLCETNTKEEIDALTDALRDGIGTLVRFK